MTYGISLLLLAEVLTLSMPVFACSFAQIGTATELAGGQNFDFPPEVSAGIVINKRNVEKTDAGFEGAPAAQPMKWVSKYGSVTFGFGNSNPVTGVNEAGLRVYRFLFMEAQYPTPDTRPAMIESLYVQYLLDTAKTVDEAIRATTAVQIYTPAFPTHFAICDATSACAVIEAIGGTLNIYSGADVKVDAVTNTNYSRSLELLAQCTDAGCKAIQDESEWRFMNAAAQIKNFSGTDFVGGDLGILQSVAQTSPDVATLWTLLTHQSATENIFYVKNTKSQRVILTVDLNKTDFSCKTPAQVSLLNPSDDSDVKLGDYSPDFQTKLATVLNQYLGVSAVNMQKWIDYPAQNMRCLE